MSSLSLSVAGKGDGASLTSLTDLLVTLGEFSRELFSVKIPSSFCVLTLKPKFGVGISTFYFLIVELFLKVFVAVGRLMLVLLSRKLELFAVLFLACRIVLFRDSRSRDISDFVSS